MKKMLCSLFIIALSSSVSAQDMNESAFYAKALSQMNNSELDSAASTLQTLLQLYPQSANAYNLLGGILKQQGDADEAIEMFRKCIQVDPAYLIAYSNLGNAYTDERELDSAIVIHQLSISIDSTRAESYNDLGDAYSKKGNLALGEACFKKAVQLNPHYGLAHFNLGDIFARQKKFKEAIDELWLLRYLDAGFPHLQVELNAVATSAKWEFKEWVKREPNSDEAHYYCSFALFYDKDEEEAVDEIQEAIRLNDKNDNYYLLKARWLSNQGKFTEAIGDCLKCLALNPQNWKCYISLGFCYEDMGDFSTAIGYFQKAVEIDSLVIQSQFSLGEAYAVIADYVSAIGPLTAAIRGGLKGPWANYDLAICYYNLGSYQLAHQNIKIARSKNLSYPQKGLEDRIEMLEKSILKRMLSDDRVGDPN